MAGRRGPTLTQRMGVVEYQLERVANALERVLSKLSELDSRLTYVEQVLERNEIGLPDAGAARSSSAEVVSGGAHTEAQALAMLAEVEREATPAEPDARRTPSPAAAVGRQSVELGAVEVLERATFKAPAVVGGRQMRDVPPSVSQERQELEIAVAEVSRLSEGLPAVADQVRLSVETQALAEQMRGGAEIPEAVVATRETFEAASAGPGRGEMELAVGAEPGRHSEAEALAMLAEVVAEAAAIGPAARRALPEVASGERLSVEPGAAEAVGRTTFEAPDVAGGRQERDVPSPAVQERGEMEIAVAEEARLREGLQAVADQVRLSVEAPALAGPVRDGAEIAAAVPTDAEPGRHSEAEALAMLARVEAGAGRIERETASAEVVRGVVVPAGVADGGRAEVDLPGVAGGRIAAEAARAEGVRVVAEPPGQTERGVSGITAQEAEPVGRAARELPQASGKTSEGDALAMLDRLLASGARVARDADGVEDGLRSHRSLPEQAGAARHDGGAPQPGRVEVLREVVAMVAMEGAPVSLAEIVGVEELGYEAALQQRLRRLRG